MIRAKNVLRKFWAEAMKTVTHIINKLPQPRLGFIAPYEKPWKCCDHTSGRCYIARNVVFDEKFSYSL